MFKVSFFVEDKHLAPIMHGLSGVARELQVVPVINAAPKASNKVKAASAAGTPTLLLLEALHKQQVQRITPIEAKVLGKQIGVPANSISYHLKKLVDAGHLKRHGKSNLTYYTVIAAPKAGD